MSKYDYLLKVPQELLKSLISKMDYTEIKEALSELEKEVKEEK